jgi:hypothetical protein
VTEELRDGCISKCTSNKLSYSCGATEDSRAVKTAPFIERSPSPGAKARRFDRQVFEAAVLEVTRDRKKFVKSSIRVTNTFKALVLENETLKGRYIYGSLPPGAHSQFGILTAHSLSPNARVEQRAADLWMLALYPSRVCSNALLDDRADLARQGLARYSSHVTVMM